MNDERSDGTHLRCLGILVIPTSIIESLASRKQFWVALGIIVHDQQHFSGDINIFEIVPVVFGSLHAVAYKHNLCVCKTRRFPSLASDHDVLLVIL